MTEHIDLMIKAEEMEKRQGFMQRINTLRESRRRAELTKYADEFRKDAHTTMSAAGGTLYFTCKAHQAVLLLRVAYKVRNKRRTCGSISVQT